jgi:hypothetical protein
MQDLLENEGTAVMMKITVLLVVNLNITPPTVTTHPDFQETVQKIHLKSRTPKLGRNDSQSAK